MIYRFPNLLSCFHYYDQLQILLKQVSMVCVLYKPLGVWRGGNLENDEP